MIDIYICPNCREPLRASDNSLKCANNHSFDRSSSGYVNLLLGAKQSNHGDSKEMLLARRKFLSLGHYFPTVLQVSEMIKNQYIQTPSIRLLDAGCGEGYYTCGIKKCLNGLGISAEIYALDVSKEAIKLASKSCKQTEFCVASVNSLPFADASFDVVISLFAPLNEKEFSRVLKNDGMLITVSPSENHLFELKKAVYEVPYKNPPSTFLPTLFRRSLSITKEWSAELTNRDDISALFKMTPYYCKSSQSDIQKALSLTTLKTTIGFNYEIFKKATV